MALRTTDDWTRKNDSDYNTKGSRKDLNYAIAPRTRSNHWCLCLAEVPVGSQGKEG
jgi:hypothetical protein